VPVDVTVLAALPQQTGLATPQHVVVWRGGGAPPDHLIQSPMHVEAAAGRRFVLS
jgi:hypothetical protein